jgi:hypothetical protein
MELHNKSLIVALVPQPRQIPPPPFEEQDLQRTFFEVSRSYPYQSFEKMIGGRGAFLRDTPEDFVELRPALLQVQAKMDGDPHLLTAEKACDKAIWILKTASKYLKVEAFLQCAIQIVAHVGIPGADPDAKAFLQERFMRDGLDPTTLGPDYFGGGVRFRSVAESGTAEDSLLIEPFIRDNKLIFLSHDVARIGMPQPISDLGQVSNWVTEAFEFLAGPAMDLLKS